MESQFPLWKSLMCGGAAGVTVDIALYPLDTLKTRLQSKEGFIRSGGFRGIYRGLGVAALGSAPGAALFFGSYDSIKQMLPCTPTSHMLAASIGEMVACLVRVPTEVIKQRQQTSSSTKASPYGSMVSSMKHIYHSEGVRGFYRGYSHTILREFPLYEYLKVAIAEVIHRPLSPWEMSLCGSLAGGVAAAITTPLDVLKTREMLRKRAGETTISYSATLMQLHAENGFRGMFLGIQPRVLWISIGGIFFFGAYEEAKYFLQRIE